MAFRPDSACDFSFFGSISDDDDDAIYPVCSLSFAPCAEAILMSCCFQAVFKVTLFLLDSGIVSHATAGLQHRNFLAQRQWGLGKEMRMEN